MKNIPFFGAATISAILLFSHLVHAQLLDRLKNTAQRKIEERMAHEVEEAIDLGADSVEASIKKKKDTKPLPENESDTTNPRVASASKFDFVPGDQVLYQEDFGQDALDEFPLRWFTDNKAEVKMLPGYPGRWLRMYHSGQVMSPIFTDKLPEDFTMEFDLILDFKDDGYVFPQFSLRLLENLPGDTDGRKYMQEDRLMQTLSAIELVFDPGTGGNSDMAFYSQQAGTAYFQKEGIKLSGLDRKYGASARLSIWVQKQRLRVWFDGDKIVDMPQAIPPALSLNRMALKFGTTIQPDEEITAYLSNIRLAAGMPDLRTKLIAEGHYTTNGILFDVNSATIKRESAAVLQEIAQVLNENPSVNLRIIGHTDDDGNDEANLELSKRRAAAVKQMLCADYRIEANRMETDGHGEGSPIASNKTQEGKARNRRVEFIKL